jgi:hypothetical protein
MINGKWGFIDKTGRMVIPAKYDEWDDVPIFSEELAAMVIGGKFGYIDKKGRIAIPPQFDDAGDFSEGMAAVFINGAYGFIDKTGRMVVQPQYNYASRFSEGLAMVSGKHDLCGYIDRTGKMVIPQRFYIDFTCIDDSRGQIKNYMFSHGRAAVSDGSLYKDVSAGNILVLGYIDRSGKWVVKPEFTSAHRFSEGMAGVSEKGCIGSKYIDGNGKEVVKQGFESEGFSEGMLTVQVGDKFGCIDKTGRFVVPLRYDYVYDFHEGLAAVSINDKWGYLDKKGKTAIPLNFLYADDFSEGLAAVVVSRPLGFTQSASDVWYMITHKGQKREDEHG